jgi:anti-sigma B factor antagonist
MKFSLDKDEKYTLLTLAEEKLDTLIAPKLKSEFITMFQSGTKNLILDLTKVKYIDSSGLSAILVANRLTSEVEGFLILVGLSEMAQKLIIITKLDNVLNIFPTVAEAREAIFLNEIEEELTTETNEEDTNEE